MNPPVFLDANIPIYAAGRTHPLKTPSIHILELAASRPGLFMTDAEVLQELLHRYRAIHAWDTGSRVLRSFMRLMQGRIVSLEPDDVAAAAEGADRYETLSARDLLHAAIMERQRITAIITADKAFELIEGVQRLDPARSDSWLDQLAKSA